ncbi:BspA family leucine-rich repeat surface protein [Zobellia laminariae]|uniref:BspA family leucine-rich repeat surface protein n=1 Tax=Zobellia laminariae TaxID=248906 RepID=UPI003EF62177
MKKLYIKTQLLFFLLGISLSSIAQSYCLELNPSFGLVPENIVANSDDGNGPCNVMDGNFYSRWSSNGLGEWISFDLGKVMDVGGVEIAFFSGNNRASIFSLEVSIDSENWSTVLESQRSSGASTNLEEFKFPTQNIRYLRYVGQGNSQENNNWNSITEFRINEPRIPEIECLDPSPSSGLVPNRIVAVLDDGNGLCNLMDNDLTSYWSSNVLGESITFELTSFKDVNQVEIAFLYGETRVSVFDILVSVDGVNWTTVLKDQSSSGTSLDLEKFNFPFQSTKYIRYTVQGNSQDNNALNGITEFRIDESVLPESNCLEINPPFGLVPENIVANSDDGNGPCNVMDGNFYSRWSSNGLSEWISFDFGELKNVGGVEIAFFSGNNRANIFDLEVSIDGENWSTVLENQSSSGASTNLEEFQFSTQNIRYLRYVGQGNSQENNNWNSITEFRINEPRIPEIECFDPSPSSGLVPNRIVAVSDDGNGPCNVMDNDLVSYWSSNFSSKSITFELDGSSDVDQVEIAFLSGDISASVFDISVSDDGANWTTVLKDGSSSGASLALEKFNFPVRNTKYLRYTAQDSQDNNDSEGVTEFRINKFVLPERDCLDSSPSTGIAPVRISVSSDDGNGPCNVMDGNYYSRWSSNGMGEWMTFDLGETKNVSDVKIAFFSGNRRSSLFDLAVSDDGSNWTNVLEGQRSSGNSISLETYSFPLQSVRYLRYIGQGNSQENNDWNSISEFRINEAEMNEFRPFVTTWKTDNPGISTDNQITIHTYENATFFDFEYDYTVDWGDGTTTSGLTEDAIHTYDIPGTYEVSIFGDFPGIYFGFSGENDEKKLLTVEQWGDNVWASFHSAYNGCSNLDIKATDIPNLTNVTSFDTTFAFCSNLKWNSTINSWDTSNITDMAYTFYSASNFNQDINNWDVVNVITMANMFNRAISFNRDINNWDVSSVSTMSSMFEGAIAFNGDISDWDTSNVVNMRDLFLSVSSFNQDISSWNTSKVKYMSNMFRGATSFNQNVGGWNVENAESMFSMFSGVTLSTENYDKLLLGWGNQELKNGVTFDAGDSQYCQGENYLYKLVNKFGWNISDGGLTADCKYSQRPFITTWKTDNEGSSADNQIKIPTYAPEIYNYSVDWGDGTSDTGITGSKTHTYEVPGVYQISISGMFPRIFMEDSYKSDSYKLISVDQWGDQIWTGMSQAFQDCKNLHILASDIPDLRDVTSFRRMFVNATSMNEDISGWDTNDVLDMSYMFLNADSFNQDISSWDTSNVNSMSHMFLDANSFNQDLSSFNISNTKDLSKMFSGSGLSSLNYDKTLIGWAQQEGLTQYITLDATNITYCTSEDARQQLIDIYDWTINDGGISCDDSDMSLTSINAKGSIINTTTLTPNPVIAETILSFEKPVQLTEINIFDVSGRLVHSYSGSAVSDDGAYLLNVEELPSGTYFIRSLDAKGEQYQKQMVINK